MKRVFATSKSLKILGLCLLASLLLTEFNNCGNYDSANTSDEDSTAAGVQCTTSNCVVPVVNNLKVTVNMDSGDFPVPANLTEFNLGGDCNEGGFPYNSIHWQLTVNEQVMRTSEYSVVNQQSHAISSCVNGRFEIYVNLGPIPGDEVDRTGLLTGGNYALNVIIWAQMVANTPAVYQTTLGETTVQLVQP